jgi:uncharacterized protein (TIRG00374 family)
LPRLSLGGRDLFKLLRLSGLIVFPIILVFGIDLTKTADVLRDSQLALVLLGLALMQGAIMLRIWRWKLVAEASGVHYPRFWDYAALFYTGLFAGAAMPQLAASFAPVLFVSEAGHSWRRAVASILFDRLVELAVILLFAFAAAVYLYPDFPELSLAVMVALATLGVGALLALPTLRYVRRWLRNGGELPWRGVASALQLLEAEETREMLTKLRACVAPVAGISAVILVLQTAIIVVLAEALNLDVSLPFLIMAWSLVTLAVTLPITIAGLGLREGVLVVMFTTVGEPKEEALALGLLFFLVVLITRLPGAFTWLRGAPVAGTSSALAPAAPRGEQPVNADG